MPLWKAFGMLSNMETTKRDLIEQDLIEIERARLAPYQAFAKDPMWVWPIIGLMVFAFMASWALEPMAVPIVVTMLYAAGLGALIAIMARRRGVHPPMRFDQMPPSLRRELFIFWGLCTVGGVGIALLQLATGWVVAGAAAGVAIAIVGMLYHARYRARVAEMAGAVE